MARPARRSRLAPASGFLGMQVIDGVKIRQRPVQRQALSRQFGLQLRSVRAPRHQLRWQRRQKQAVVAGETGLNERNLRSSNQIRRAATSIQMRVIQIDGDGGIHPACLLITDDALRGGSQPASRRAALNGLTTKPWRPCSWPLDPIHGRFAAHHHSNGSADRTNRMSIRRCHHRPAG